MVVKEHVDITALTTFGLRVKTLFFVEFQTVDDIVAFISNDHYSQYPKLVLGGGSNLLFCSDFKGVVMKLKTSHIFVKEIVDDEVFVVADGGVVWDDFVLFCVNHGFYGVENLSYIPGSVGACPVQNIGAYGVEINNLIEYVSTIDLATGTQRILTNSECQFGYRDSIFKRECKGKYIVTSVCFKLSLKPTFHLEYSDLKNRLGNSTTVSLLDVRNSVIDIRKQKLPDPSVQGNAGSFFKNPVVSRHRFQALLDMYPSIPHYVVDDSHVKLASGWLIDQAGWKGYSRGNVGVHQSQALVLVNRGNATGEEIVTLADDIRTSVLSQFGVELEPEVNYIS